MNFTTEKQLSTYFRSLNRPMSSMVWYQLNSSGFAKSGTGVTLERQIPGFLTTKTTGRDALSANITELSYNHRDGAIFRSKRNLSRDITIEYTLTSVDEKSHRKKLNKMRSILMGLEHEQAVFRFRDEPDVFYVGSVKSITEAKFVRSFASNGQIQIHCADPFKYSWKVYKASPVKEDGKLQFKIAYKGTYPSSPKFVVKHSNDQENGYIAFTDEQSHIVQVGDPSEKDGYEYKATARDLVSVDFESASKLNNNGWHFNIFTAPTANTPSAHPIYTDGTFYKYFKEFARTENSKLPDGSGLWLKDPGPWDTAKVKTAEKLAAILQEMGKTAEAKTALELAKDSWHGPSIFHGFYDASGKPLHATKTPVTDLHLDMKYVFGKQTNGKENMQAGYEIILFGIDKDKPFTGAVNSVTQCFVKDNNSYFKPNGAWKTINSKDYTDIIYNKTIDGAVWQSTYIPEPLIRIAIWNTSPNNTKAKAWIQINQKHKKTINFDCKMPLELKVPPKNADGWVQVTGGKWRYYKNNKFLKGWQKLKDSKGTFWFYFDANGYMLTGVHELIWSKSINHFYFNSRGEMAANKTVSVTIDGTSYNLKFNKDGVCTNWPGGDEYNPAKKTGWKGSGKLWRYYISAGNNQYTYVTGWNKLKDSKGTFWFYFGSGGYMLYGFQKLKYNKGKSEGTFYFDTNGHMVTGTKKIGKETYTFASNGVLEAPPSVGLTQVSTGDIIQTSEDMAYGESAPTDVYQKMTMSTLTIEKYQNKVSVTINGKTYTYTGDIPDTCIFTGVGIQEYVLGAHGKFTYTQNRINKGTPIGVQYIDSLEVKQLTTKWKDSKNSLAKGSKVVVNCGTGDIYYNGKKKPSLGALGNDYDTLQLMPSYEGEKTQRIQCLYSKWVAHYNEPEFEIQYREVFL